MNAAQQSLLPSASTQIEERRAFYAELLCFESARRYRPGWSRNAYIDRYGASPPDDWIRDFPAMHVSPGTFAWIQARAANFAKSRERRGR